ncbi:STAS/SEC14 domain-containing protein [Oleiagrimonas citrea]|uniref:STAS/SEC14 domain-containing protein n=1 Tax=Oleiagrimonas citrea TaxID=1665687 RepID=A0A846ZIM5_9GAMM|nr:STAS/SEC14 domain-containing protein [Oleiagrimonas citrea]NKZ37439.1 STAS/SEC14 domain-containing protein [Oleiagrimonas citrea]
MIKQMTGLPAGVVGFSAHGEVTADDYENVIVPDLEAMFALRDKVRLLYHFADDFTGFETRAMWDDAKLGLRHFSGFERVAIVGDIGWIAQTVPAISALFPGEFRSFPGSELPAARAWLLEGVAGD